MKLALFNGGLNIRQAPELIQPNEALQCLNVDTTTDQVVSAKGLGEPIASSSCPYFFESEYIWFDQANCRDYLDYQGKLYYTDGSKPKKYFNGVTQDLGIEEPAYKPNVSLSYYPTTPPSESSRVAGSLTGTFSYIYTYYNSSTGTETAASDELSVTLAAEDIELAFTTGDVSYDRIRIYRSGASNTYNLLASIANTGTPTYIDSTVDISTEPELPNLISGTVQYVYTYYNVDDGTESQPSPVSAELETTEDRVDLTVYASSDPQVTNIKLYRIGGALLSFTEVAELSNSTQTYTDEIPWEDITGSILTSELNGKPPATLRYIRQAFGTFFGAVGPRLYFTLDIGNPNYWPETYYIDFDRTITGIAVAASGIVVFTKYQTYMVTGTSATTFVKYLIDSTQGCINYKSIVESKGLVLFVSTDGICTLSGSKVDVVSKFKLGKQTYDVGNAVLHDETYYLQLTDKSIVAFDTRYTPMFKEFNFGTEYLVVAQDILYGVIGTDRHKMFAGDKVTYAYETGNLTEGYSSQIKDYNDVYLSGEGSYAVDIYIDNILVKQYEGVFETKPTTLAVPQNLQRGTSIRFAITGVGKLRELEYKAQGRTNGR